MANTFLYAQGINVGKSLCERDLAETAREIMAKAGPRTSAILLPDDVVVADQARGGRADPHGAGRPGAGGRDDPRRRPERRSSADRPRSLGAARRCSGTARSAPSRSAPSTRAPSRGAQGGRADQGRQAQLGRRRRRHRGGAERRRRRSTISPTSRPPAAPSSNGWKARRCRGSRRCALARPAARGRLPRPRPGAGLPGCRCEARARGRAGERRSRRRVRGRRLPARRGGAAGAERDRGLR